MSDLSTVQVALRIRPLVQSEIERGCHKCLMTTPNDNQIQVIGTDKTFSYNYVFDDNVSQEQFYNTSVKGMLKKLFTGYNVTILAYGQTGSGKTHSMGTSYTGCGEKGIIPRVIADMFNYINENSDEYMFTVKVSFLELYNENLYDLLSTKPRDQCIVDIREDTKGIKIPGLTEHEVLNVDDTIDCLIRGSSGRATGATAMNQNSSRSHAIFSIIINFIKKSDTNNNKTAKFHLVDLAGSERSKKTKATGERFREGININKGLLALGNVISALGDETSKGFISYRESKLTRLLQDSLGGNSITLMIVCVSPADYNLEETLSSLRYADRARRIKNKPVINIDPQAAEIARLKLIIQQLECHKSAENGNVLLNFNDYQKLKEDKESLQQELQEKTAALSTCMTENVYLTDKCLTVQVAFEQMKNKFSELKEAYNIIDITDVNINGSCIEKVKSIIDDIQKQQSITEIEMKNCDDQITPLADNIKSNETDVLDLEKQDLHAKAQLNLNFELKNLNKELAVKEHLFNQMMNNVCENIDYKSLNECQEKIQKLEKEKKDLQRELQTKTTEETRKKIRELESLIAELKRKVHAQSDTIKSKEKDETKMKTLMAQITSLKTSRVQLLRTMKSEEQRFRLWKTQREKELNRLKMQNQKKDNDMIRMERKHNQQRAVLIRQLEYKTSLQKRWQEILRKPIGKGSKKIEEFVASQYDIMYNKIEAQCTLNIVNSDIDTIKEQINLLNAETDESNKIEIQESLQQFQIQLDLRESQKKELEKKIKELESVQKTFYECLVKVTDLRKPLQILYEKCQETCKREVDYKMKYNEKELLFNEVQTKLTQCEEDKRRKSLEFMQTLHEFQKEYDTTIANIKNPRGISNRTEDTGVQYELEEYKEENVDDFKKELEEKNQEIENLKERLNQVNSYAQQKKITKSKNNKTISNGTYLIPPDVDLDESFDYEDNINNDPDWKNTPLYKRIYSMKNKQEKERQGKKRGSDGTVRCYCKTNCATKQCGCKKLNGTCSENCKCDATQCVNRCGIEEIKKKLSFGDTEHDEPVSKKVAPLSDITIKRKQNFFSDSDNEQY